MKRNLPPQKTEKPTLGLEVAHASFRCGANTLSQDLLVANFPYGFRNLGRAMLFITQGRDIFADVVLRYSLDMSILDGIWAVLTFKRYEKHGVRKIPKWIQF